MRSEIYGFRDSFVNPCSYMKKDWAGIRHTDGEGGIKKSYDGFRIDF